MKLRLSIILLAAALAAAPAAGQTIKSLGYNTTNGQIVYSGTNDLRFPATIRIGTNQSGFSSDGQFLTLTDGAGGVAMIIGTNAITSYDPIAFSSTGNAAATRTNLALGETNNVTFSNITATGIVTANDSTATPATNAAAAQGIQWPGLGGSQHAAIYGGYSGAAQIALAVGTSNSLSDVATFRATGMTVASNAVVGGTLAVSNTATFSTNVTVNGNLSVGSLTTTTPSTWALDTTQTAADTNGILALPSNANVIRLTNNNAISGVSGGVLGAFYYLVNQTTNAVTISNVGGITVQGGTPLTLGAGQAATLVATGATNASVAARGDLNDVALGGTANTAPSQTASSGSSLMTRDLVGQELANPRTKMQTTYWFGLEGLGYWTTIGTNAVTRQSGVGPGMSGGTYIYSSTRIGANSAGAGLRLFNDVDYGPSPYQFSNGGALTMRARVRKNSVVDRPAFAFLMGSRTATQMWQQNAYGIYFVPQPTNSWVSNAVVTQHSRIAVSNVVWAVNTAGTNGPTEPVWTDLIGSLVTNGSAVYVNAGPHTSNNWVLAIGSTNASQVVMTNTGKEGPPNVNRAEVVLKLRIDGTTNTPYTIYGSVQDYLGETAEVSLTTTNNDGRGPQFWSRTDEATSGIADYQIRYISIDNELTSF